MSRTIKFRVWDYSQRQMFYVNELVWSSSRLTVNGSLSEETLSQFTGFLDRNGKEIYEGDVLKFGDGISKEFTRRQGHVVFDYGQFFVTVEAGRFFCSLAALAHQKDGDGCEILGNLYEHPELGDKKPAQARERLGGET